MHSWGCLVHSLRVSHTSGAVAGWRMSAWHLAVTTPAKPLWQHCKGRDVCPVVAPCCTPDVYAAAVGQGFRLYGHWILPHGFSSALPQLVAEGSRQGTLLLPGDSPDATIVLMGCSRGSLAVPSRDNRSVPTRREVKGRAQCEGSSAQPALLGSTG